MSATVIRMLHVRPRLIDPPARGTLVFRAPRFLRILEPRASRTVRTAIDGVWIVRFDDDGRERLINQRVSGVLVPDEVRGDVFVVGAEGDPDDPTIADLTDDQLAELAARGIEAP